MQPFVLSPLVLFVFAVVFIVVVTGSSSRRRREAARRYEMKVCGHCGTTQPAHAAYCRECGRAM